ncbi:MAG: NAD(P)-dependent glycerol-3-phosphate dehydrogenase [Desulfovibrio sp.]|nr:NAD(P)-dependent glycerol-3-phosphate dehydrogenase [Desulfovibrio sp.]
MSLKKLTICVAGGGSWGTALAHMAASHGHRTTIYMRRPEVCHAVNTLHENPAYLPGLRISKAVQASTDPAVLDAECVILAVPCQQQRAFLEHHRRFFQQHATVLNVAKGIELATLKTGSCFVPEILKEKAVRYAVLSGPSFAKEVMKNKPTAVVIASAVPDLAEDLMQSLSSPSFRCYASHDVVGCEVGGAVKNVIAIAAGLCDGMQVGTNGRAALVTRGLAEMSRLGATLGAQPLTFMGLTGLGDLVLTTTGDLSRNRQVGLGLGQGKSLDEVTREIGMVAEGVKTAFAVQKLAQSLKVSAPITDAVCAILDGSLKPEDAVLQLMTRGLRME